MRWLWSRRCGPRPREQAARMSPELSSSDLFPDLVSDPDPTLYDSNFMDDSDQIVIADELVHEKEKFKAISDELDQTFAEMSGY